MAAADSTVYDIRLRYAMDDHAAQGATKLANNLDKAAGKAKNLEFGLGRIAAVAAGAFGMMQAKKSLIDFNSTMEQAKLGMAGMFELNLGGAFELNMQRSNALVDRLQIRMKSAVGTTKEAVAIASQLAQPFTAAGASLKQMEDMSVGVVVGAKAMGIAAEVSARDVDQALRGQYHATDQFTGKLLGARGFAGEQGREKFNKLTAQQRFKTLNEALNDPALMDLAKAQASSFDGVLSTFQDGLEIFMGKVGKPLFAAVTKELQNWNQWMDANGRTLEKFASKMGEYFVDAFTTLRDSIAFIIDHKGTLLAIAAAYGGMKVAGGVTGMLSNAMGAAAGGAAGGLKGGLVGAAFGLGAGLLAAGGAKAAENSAMRTEAGKEYGSGLSGGAQLARAMASMDSANALYGMPGYKDAVAEAQKEFDEAAKKVKAFADAVGATDARGILEALSGDKRFAGSYLKGEDFKEAVGMGKAEADAAYDRAFDAIAAAGSNIFKANDELSMDPKNKKPKDKDIKVTINRIEVKSDDPDRFIFGLQEAINDTIRNGSASMAALVR